MLNRSEIETYAKYMVCPSDIHHNASENGLNSYARYNYRQASEYYKGTSDPSKIMDELIAALRRNLDGSKEPILLLSDGKDSMSLALALSKMNLHCKTLTLLRKNDDSLKKVVEEKCALMGHIPYFIEIDEIINSFDHALFMKSCRLMKNPVLDQGMIFFLGGLDLFFEKEKIDPNTCQLIDGLGNDEHLGYLPSKSQRHSFIISKFGLWKFNKFLPRFVNWYIRSPAESQGDLSAISCFFGFKNSYDLNSYFSKIKIKSDAEYIDFRAFSRGSFHDHQCMIGKTKVAAYAHGADIIYPWTDSILANYCFNLPSEHKFDFNALKNKLILRRVLQDELSWKQEKRGVDLFIDLDVDKFIPILNNYVDTEVIMQILKVKLIPSSVKKRALLELLNFSGYLNANGYTRGQIISLLIGDKDGVR
ncbi:hypothetical protein ACET8H_01790 [Aeromonas veronii]